MGACALRESSRTISLPWAGRGGEVAPFPEDQILQLTAFTPRRCQGAESFLRNGVCVGGGAVLQSGRPGHPGERCKGNGARRSPKPAWDGGGAGSRVAEAPGTFRERLEKLIYWNFRSVEILRFPPPSPAPGVSAPTCFLSAEILPSAGVGMGGKIFSFTVGYFLNQN